MHAAGRERNCWTPKNYDGGTFNKRFLLALYQIIAHRRRERLFPHETTAYRALGYHTTFCLFDRRDDFPNSILRSFRMRAINWGWSTKTTVGAPNQRQRFVELFPALAQALVQTPA